MSDSKEILDGLEKQLGRLMVRPGVTQAEFEIVIEQSHIDDHLYEPPDDDNEYDGDSDDDWMDECGLMDDGQCAMAGTEHCDFSCPNRDSEDFAGSAAWHKKHGANQ